MQEISHRVKNSLTLVATLLHMQGRTSPSLDLKSALEDAETLVRTVAQLHDRLWRTHEVHTVDLAKFLAELCERLGCSAGPNQTLSQDFVPVTIATNQAVPVALLVNELVTNAFKDAYPGREGEVRVSVRPAAGG